MYIYVYIYLCISGGMWGQGTCTPNRGDIPGSGDTFFDFGSLFIDNMVRGLLQAIKGSPQAPKGCPQGP